MRINETGKRQRLAMHWWEYAYFLPAALSTLFRKK